MTTTLTYYKDWADALKEILQKHYPQITVVPDSYGFVSLIIEYKVPPECGNHWLEYRFSKKQSNRYKIY